MAKELADLATLLGGRRRPRLLPALPLDLLLDREIVPDPPAPRPTNGSAGAPAEAGPDPWDAASLAALDRSIDRAANHLLGLQSQGGYWVAELEANIALVAEWILCRRYIGLVDAARERKLVNYLKLAQRPDGGWNLYDDAPSDVSISIEAYFAAKLTGTSPDEPWMARARAFIREQGGAEKSRVLTRIFLALFGQMDWRALPALPVSVMFMPRGTAFNIYEMSYWARTCTIPLLVLYYKRRVVAVPPELGIPELFLGIDPTIGWESGIKRLSWKNFFLQADKALKALDKLPLTWHREKACKLAEEWILAHQDESGDWGGIFPAMTHSLMALHVLGYPLEGDRVRRGIQALERLEIAEGDTIRVQPCVSPVWDTAWAVIALSKAGYGKDHKAIRAATDWLYSMQIRRAGDWAIKCPGVKPGGWAFQFYNDFYPDTDDSSVVLQALLNSDYKTDPGNRERFEVGLKWLLALQNKDGGWGAFERDVDNEIYNEILFNDAKNMLDPSTSDVTGRCLELLGKLGYPRNHPITARAIRFLAKEQEIDGKWWGRWGVNYLYGTWSVLCALRAAGVGPDEPMVARAAAWLVRVQNKDGGFGESCRSYEGGPPAAGASVPSSTAWALMGLLASGRGDGKSARRAVDWLLERQKEDGGWDETAFTGTGFPGCFYLRYHWYRLYFPLLALARYRELVR
jgi:squalene-hopene/tetraprenyl-beta-curcumene cyclase